MRQSGWERVTAVTDDGRRVEAQAPLIVSASRATDIPAFYADWFMERLRRGYLRWRNPFSGVPLYVSFAKTRFIVFWSKNPEPMLRHLDELDRMGLGYYFQYTLNDYATEGLEPNVPPAERRVETFRRLSGRLGPERVVWRADPLLITEQTPPEVLIARVAALGDRLAPLTRRLVFSFADIAPYRRVKANLRQAGVQAREFTVGEMEETAAALAELNRSRGWGLTLETCAETPDLTRWGVAHGRCVDERIMTAVSPHDRALREFLGVGSEAVQEDLFSAPAPAAAPRDRGQRAACGCVRSKDVGEYNTCPHRCLYCYANISPDAACRRAAAARRGESISG